MDNLIDYTYFFGLIKLPYVNLEAELNTPSENSVNIELNRLTMAITEYQLELLTKLFGSEVIPTGLETMVYNDAIKKSIIADYTFCKIMEEFVGELTMSGEKVHTSDNSQNGEYTERYFAVWNRMCKKCIAIRQSLYDSGEHATYPTENDENIYSFKSFLC